MHRKTLICALSLFTTALAFAPLASAGPGPKDKGKGTETIKVQLRGLEEAPVVISGASGELVLEIDDTVVVLGPQARLPDAAAMFVQPAVSPRKDDA